MATFAIVSSFAGARAEGAAQVGTIAVLLFGLANLFADAVAMGLGTYLSDRSQREVFRRQRHVAMDRINRDPCATCARFLCGMASATATPGTWRAFRGAIRR